MTSCRVIVMAKAPVPGQAKTRLIPALGADGSAALARRLLDHAVAQAVQAALGPVEVCCTPDATHPAFRQLAGAGTTLSAQGDGDLGERMARAFDRVLASAATRALLIGTDAPDLDADVLREAARALDTFDAVFVPAFDGGYALVGLRRPAPGLFEHMPWSTPEVMARTREGLARAGLRYAELAPVHDIDEGADLPHLPAHWLISAPRPTTYVVRPPRGSGKLRAAVRFLVR